MYLSRSVLHVRIHTYKISPLSTKIEKRITEEKVQWKNIGRESNLLKFLLSLKYKTICKMLFPTTLKCLPNKTD